MIDKQRLANRLLTQDIKLAEAQLNMLDRYAELLCEWNEKINLTAIVQPEEIENKHFFDSIMLASLSIIKGKLVDVGSGAGFPGMVIKIIKPEVDVTLMEPTGKRVTFLNAVAEELGLQITVEKERAEEAARKTWREVFDVATARAVSSLPSLCEYCLPLVKKGGYFLPMKADVREELQAAQTAVRTLGAKLEKVIDYTLPDGSQRTVLQFAKTQNTPPKYPRAGARIKNNPL